MAQKRDDIVIFDWKSYYVIEDECVNTTFRSDKKCVVSLGAETTIVCRSLEDAKELAWEIEDISKAPDTGSTVYQPEVTVTQSNGRGVVSWGVDVGVGKRNVQKEIDGALKDARSLLQLHNFVVVEAASPGVDDQDLLRRMLQDKNLIIQLPWLPSSMEELLRYQLGLLPGEKGYLIAGRGDAIHPRLMMNEALAAAYEPDEK